MSLLDMNRAKIIGYSFIILLLFSCGKNNPAIEQEPDIRYEIIGAYNITCQRSHIDSLQQPSFTINYTDELRVERIDTSDLELKVGNVILKPTETNEVYYSYTDYSDDGTGQITELRFYPPDSVSFTDSGTGGNDLLVWTCTGKKK